MARSTSGLEGESIKMRLEWSSGRLRFGGGGSLASSSMRHPISCAKRMTHSASEEEEEEEFLFREGAEGEMEARNSDSLLEDLRRCASARKFDFIEATAGSSSSSSILSGFIDFGC